MSYLEALSRQLEVMDRTALTMCMDHGMPIVVFDIMEPGSIPRVVAGEPIGTLVGPGETVLAGT